MALDGAFLRHLIKETEERAVGARVDKVCQPNADELVLVLRSPRETMKLLLSARADSARLCFTESAPENPMKPPMLCMLLRKKLGGARLSAVRQVSLERAVFLDFDAQDEMGDPTRLTLVCEIMGRCSNVILLDGEGKIIDALRRIDASMKSERLILPKFPYELPPQQKKLSLLEHSPQEILSAISALSKEDCELQKALLSVLMGLSPIVCREGENFVSRGSGVTAKTMSKVQEDRLTFWLSRLSETVSTCSGTPVIVVSAATKKPLDFSFVPILQYASSAVTREEKSFSALLEAFFGERDFADRMRVKSQDLLRLLSNASERLGRKIAAQRAELSRSEKREELRLCGDLITAGQYTIPKGVSEAKLINYYDETLPEVAVRLDPALSAAQNAAVYYKRYRKAKTAEEKLTEQIGIAEKELSYLDTVFDELSRAQNEGDLSEIRAELTEEGYLKRRNGKDRKNREKKTEPLCFTTSDGFTVLVGRNNRQNDELTLKKAQKQDLWFHTKDIPGSHTILVTEGKIPGETAITEAALFAAKYSKAKDSSKVPVDYTAARYVSKPQGAKPGMVIYVNQKTLYVSPQEEKR